MCILLSLFEEVLIQMESIIDDGTKNFYEVKKHIATITTFYKLKGNIYITWNIKGKNQTMSYTPLSN